MAVLALGLVGSAIGGAIGGSVLGMSAASLGWMAGSTLGGLLFAPSQHSEGPRVGDLSVQVSTYGTMKPIVYGAMREAGNVIFCTDKREVATTTHSGKGGPKVSQTTYTYNVDIAIALCQGPIAGIRKILLNGALIYDISSGADVSTVIASSTHSAGFKVYLGDETQLPDPTIEATVGVGLVPGYRGTAYVVFDHMDCPNGQIPQLAFEVVAVGSAGAGNPIYDSPAAAAGTMASVLADNSWQFVSADAVSPITLVGPGYDSVERSIDFHVAAVAEFPPVPVQGGPYALKASFTSSSYAFPMNLTLYHLDTGAGSTLMTYTPGTSGNALRPLYAAFDPVSGAYCAVAALTDTGERGNAITILPSNVLTPALDTPSTPMAFYNGVIYTCGLRLGVTYLKKYDGVSGAFLSEVSAGANHGAANLLVHADAGGVFVIDNSLAGIGTARSVWKVGTAWTLLTATAFYDNAAGSTTTFYANDRFAIVGPSNVAAGHVDYRVLNFASLDGTEVNVADVIRDQCVRAGLTSGQVDTTGITDALHGYAVNRVASARANIQPLLTAYILDAFAADGLLKFRKRAAQTVVATIGYDDLGTIEPGAAAVDPLPLTRTQESELPRSVALTYINQDADYQPGVETARRQITGSSYDVAQDLAIATTAAHMATVAAAMLYDSWNSRTPRKASLTRQYAYLTAGDNVSVEYPRGSFSTKRLTLVTDTGVLLNLELVDSDPALYAVTAPGATPAMAQAGVIALGPTRLALLDIPLLRDADNDAGLYAAMRGYAPTGWTGAVMFTGPDAAHLTAQGGLSQAAIMGSASTVLPAWSYGLFDEINTVDVQLYAGALSSATRDDVLNLAANAALLGNEVIQFRTASSLGGGLYRLSGLLRGRLGTEWAGATHVAGERFVLLEALGLLRTPMDLADVGVLRAYQAVTVGQSADSAAVQTLASTAAGLKPLAPANLDVARDGTLVYLRWVRRSRLRDNWLAGTVPLAETSEAYQIQVTMPGGGVQNFDAAVPSAVLDLAGYTPLGLPQTTDTGAGRWAVSSGGFVYAFKTGTLVKLNATDLSLVASVGLISSVTRMILAAGALYTIDIGNPASGVLGKLKKWNLDLTLASEISLPLAGDGYGLVYCAGALWASLAYSAVVRRIDPTTLATVANVAVTVGALATDGTYVYGVNRAGSSAFKIDPASNTSVLTIALDPAGLSGPPEDVVAAGGHLWLQSVAGLQVYSTSTGAVFAHSLNAPGAQITTDGTDVCIFDPSTNIGLVADATTVLAVGSFTVPAPAHPEHQAAASLLSINQLVVNDGTFTDYYERTTNLTGTVINVYQMSAAVGRGFAATREL